MMQRSTLLFLLMSLGVGFLLFQVKYAVVEIEDKLIVVTRQMKREQENIHILKAEWTHLNEPQRLQKLAEKFLDVVPANVQQMVSLDQGFEERRLGESGQPQTRLATYTGER